MLNLLKINILVLETAKEAHAADEVLMLQLPNKESNFYHCPTRMLELQLTVAEEKLINFYSLYICC
jgi:hypothetical protein